MSTESGRKTTIYDVAARAGVSPSTVSRALAKPGRVSASTAARVVQAARDVGYQRALPTATLRGLPTQLLAIVTADISNPVFHSMIAGAESAAEAAGYTVIIVDARESPDRERRMAEQFIPAVDGLILASSRLSDSGIRSLAKQRPLITLNRVVQGLPAVLTDGVRGGRKAAHHLHELGHAAATYLSGPETSWPNGVRWRGFQDGGEEVGLATRRIGPFSPTVEGGIKAARVWAGNPTSSVFAYNDIMAVGFIREVTALGVSVPGDVSVVGFDSSPVAQLTTPSITSLSSPLQQQGVHAAKNLISLINGAETPQEPVLLPVRLQARGSTAAFSEGLAAKLAPSAPVFNRPGLVRSR
ncbi:MAG: LacI family transcriptional regulator [Arthrobacter sp.]|jgi:LacI family transcriptional regulator|nr:LacI family transcriptional regulator [Arthrobacter sp.]